jgi:hypothetical protein
MVTKTEIEEYVRENYGSCTQEKCACLRDGWLGTICPFWKPLDGESFQKLVDIFLRT